MGKCSVILTFGISPVVIVLEWHFLPSVFALFYSAAYKHHIIVFPGGVSLRGTRGGKLDGIPTSLLGRLSTRRHILPPPFLSGGFKSTFICSTDTPFPFLIPVSFHKELYVRHQQSQRCMVIDLQEYGVIFLGALHAAPVFFLRRKSSLVSRLSQTNRLR